MQHCQSILVVGPRRGWSGRLARQWRRCGKYTMGAASRKSRSTTSRGRELLHSCCRRPCFKWCKIALSLCHLVLCIIITEIKNCNRRRRANLTFTLCLFNSHRVRALAALHCSLRVCHSCWMCRDGAFSLDIWCLLCLSGGYREETGVHQLHTSHHTRENSWVCRCLHELMDKLLRLLLLLLLLRQRLWLLVWPLLCLHCLQMLLR
mmetsp:Transcript_74935/g.188641  ORF Transcript_74935/g.188641 Transcript_74935/m.188641 type:complete len:206 (+) Transcript_74935:1005-1622(+)